MAANQSYEDILTLISEGKERRQQMARQCTTVEIVYNARGRDVLTWCIKTAFLSLITLGFYLPVAANRLVKYLCEHTKIRIDESEVSGT